jgi:serine phosphatase RsbU (regulator of sigma subunit)
MLHNCAFITLLLGEHYGKRSTVEALPRQPADETQKNLLPAAPPQSPYFDITGHSLYCSATDGDDLDHLRVSGRENRDFGLVVGDVSGHGIEARTPRKTI